MGELKSEFAATAFGAFEFVSEGFEGFGFGNVTAEIGEAAINGDAFVDGSLGGFFEDKGDEGEMGGCHDLKASCSSCLRMRIAFTPLRCPRAAP